MSKPLRRIIWWAGIAAYLAIVYSTLQVAPAIWDKINGLLDGKAVGIFYLIAGIAVIAVVFYLEEVRHKRSALNYLIFFVLAGLFFFLAVSAKFPAEKIHMAEYGLLSVLFYNALKIELDRYDPKLYIIASVLCVFSGLVDEVLQGILPNRVFDWKDVGLNAAGGIITLLVIRVNILSGREKHNARMPYR